MLTQIQPSAALEPLLRSSEVVAMARALKEGRRIAAAGASGSSAALTAAALARLTGRPCVLVVAHLDDADESVESLSALGIDARRLPALELAPGETQVSLDLMGERLELLRALAEGALPPASVLVCSIHSLMQLAPTRKGMEKLALALRPGDARGPAEIIRWLDAAGYRRVDAVEEPGDFAVRGGILDIFLPAASGPGAGSPAVRLDFFGDELESIAEIDLGTMGSDRKLSGVEVVGASAETLREAATSGVCPVELMPREAIAVLHETMEVTEQARGYFERVTDGSGVIGPPAALKALQSRFHAFAELNQFSSAAAVADVRIELPARPLRAFSPTAADAVRELGELAQERRVVALCQNEGERQRLTELTAELCPGARIECAVAYLHRGFSWDGPGEDCVALVPHHELMHRYQTRRRARAVRPGRAMDAFLEFETGDYVVHADHGVARFLGLKVMQRKAPPGAPTSAGSAPQTVSRRSDDLLDEEHLLLEFAGASKLYVPASQIEKVQRYVGGFKGKPPLSTLGGKRWQRQKEQTREAVKDLAAEMLRIQAAREHMPGVAYPADTPWQNEFEAEFPYQETEDQLAALAEIKRDMQSPRPMDRIICGDVGYGKTELAIRAAFKAAEYGKQVAVLAPTTVLAEQHERTFRERYSGYPFRVESLSRFKTHAEQTETLARLAKGQVDVVIGTHRLLSQDVDFADLGLVVIDEEQRFGVEHKQKLLVLRMTVDLLTLSATPIPRTLHMALLGARDISSLATAPTDRRAIVTEVIPYNEKRMAAAIARELAREGQVFWVHNRIHDIREVADRVQKLAPDARIVIGHGQMSPHDLEEVMHTFMARRADILVSTTIIESGIDIPTANTMIIDDADRYGLADLHQLRGRVGRHKHRAYCYLLLPEDRPVTDTARRRLKAVEEYSMLGAGFKIAMRDLEIRGAGNMLGPEQSGHIAAVGYELYCRLLEQSVHELKNEKVTPPTEIAVDIGLAGYLPKGFIPSDLRRMEAYRRLAQAATLEDLARIEQDLRAAYGEPPGAAARLLTLAAIRIGARALGVVSIAVRDKDVILCCADPVPTLGALEGIKGTVRALPPRERGAPHEVYFRPPPSFLEPASLALVLKRRVTGEARASA